MGDEEIKIPDFLRRENAKPLSEEDETFFRLRDEYEKRFNSDFGTEERSYSTIEWIAFMEYCLNHNVPMEEIIGIDYYD